MTIQVSRSAYPGYDYLPDTPAWMSGNDAMAKRWRRLVEILPRLGDKPLGPVMTLDQLELYEIINDMSSTNHQLEQALLRIADGDEVDALTPEGV